MALFEVILTQIYQGQNTVNRWNYVSSGTPAAVTLSYALASAMGAIYDLTAIPPAYPPNTLIDRISELQDAQVLFNTLSVRNVYSTTDFYETPFTPALNGTQSGDGNSPAVAIGYRTNRIQTDVRRGTKRFVGIPESFVGDGGTLSIGSGGNIDQLRLAMNATLTYDDEGNTLSFLPCVCGREKYEVMKDGLPTGRFAYKYFPDLAEQLEHTAQGVQWQAYDVVRTQVSRQYGRGR
jgi:hypothetical protein